MTIIDDAARAVALGMDRAFLDPNRDAVLDTAGGLVSPASITFGATQIVSNGNGADQLTADDQTAMLALNGVNIPLPECVWIMSQRVATHIVALRTTTGAAAFPDFSLNGGVWIGGLRAHADHSNGNNESSGTSRHSNRWQSATS